MRLRLPVMISALAFVLAFVAAPHEHLHRDTGVQHAHVSSHQSGHHHDDAPGAPADHEREAGTIVSVMAFVAPGAISILTPDPVDGPALPVVMVDAEAIGSIASPEPCTHGPPPEPALAPRPPPV